ncbi:MAG: FAD-binding oxidoreductase [Spirochaetaceae bacterium]|jgi:FAD/FMN-containing dehydrogenase|nr:FAD-binding oxidoreductase [Spirochaetaceae bacterium]
MKISKAEALAGLQKMFGDAVITEKAAIEDYDGANDTFPKAYGLFTAPQPICIVNAKSTEDVSKALKYCNDNGIVVIPRTGMSSYEGLLTGLTDEMIVLDGSAMNKVLETDFSNMMVTCQCGVPLDTLEKSLKEKGYTTGHSPQSLPLAQIGGLVATRSIGQFSTYYGAIEDLICGLEAVMPDGRILRIRNVPRRSAGPDLRHLFMGSEGGLAFITEVTLKLFHYYPDSFYKAGFIVPSMEEGFECIRKIVTAGYRPSVVRLYDKADYEYNYGTGVNLGDNEAYMFFVAEGPASIAKATGEAIDQFAKEAKARPLGSAGVEHWLIHRNDLCNLFKNPQVDEFLRNTPIFYATTEISSSYTDIMPIYRGVMENVPKKVPNLVMLGGHASHAYQNGINVYFVYQFKGSDPKIFPAEYQAIIDAICEEVLKLPTGGCVHHHGMGKQRVKFAPQEHGSSYFLMDKIKEMMDPNRIMNPGVLVAGK